MRKNNYGAKGRLQKGACVHSRQLSSLEGALSLLKALIIALLQALLFRCPQIYNGNRAAAPLSCQRISALTSMIYVFCHEIMTISFLYPLQNSPYDLKDSAEAWRNLQAQTAAYYSYDPTMMAYPYNGCVNPRYFIFCRFSSHFEDY